MYLCDQWQDYEVLDTGDGEKLERWGKIILRRPDPQVIWPKARPEIWNRAQATYSRAETGGGQNIPVDVTAVKQVKKVPSGKPGIVIYHTYRTVIANPYADIVVDELNAERKEK